MTDRMFLTTPAAVRLYDGVKELPIVDYHCHLSPAEIAADRPFETIGELWLGGDHYKWRLMREAGIEERLITGDAPWREKFIAFASALEKAPGSPLYHWAAMELARYFGITTPLSAATAAEIYEAANRVIREEKLSPVALLKRERVEAVCTTDDPADPLTYHEQIAASDCPVRVLPSFRTDRLLQFARPAYTAYLERFGAAAGVEITDLGSLKEAILRRLDDFTAHGCRFTDVGIPDFPDRVAPESEADRTFGRILAGQTVPPEAAHGLLGYLYRFLGSAYRERNLVMQWHLSVIRNANTALFEAQGPDRGGDCVGDPVPGADIVRMLDAIEQNGGLPETILYTLNESNAAQIASIAGSFRRVRSGAAWWFCDHKRGIERQLSVIAENSPLGCFAGMLTDSRSFLSYARHDYFRRILCDFLGKAVEAGEFPEESAAAAARAVSYENASALIQGDKA